MLPLLSIGERVKFCRSKRNKEVLFGTIQSMEKNQVTILTDNLLAYTVNRTRVKSLTALTPLSSTSKPKKPSRHQITQLNQLNQQITNFTFSLHGAQRYEERLSNYSPEQLESFLLDAEPAPWEVVSGGNVKAFYYAPEKLIFLTDYTGKKIVTTYKKYNAPSNESLPLVKKVKHRQQREFMVLKEDLDEVDDSRICHLATKSLKREKRKISKNR